MTRETRRDKRLPSYTQQRPGRLPCPPTTIHRKDYESMERTKVLDPRCTRHEQLTQDNFFNKKEIQTQIRFLNSRSGCVHVSPSWESTGCPHSKSLKEHTLSGQSRNTPRHPHRTDVHIHRKEGKQFKVYYRDESRHFAHKQKQSCTSLFFSNTYIYLYFSSTQEYPCYK